MTQDNPNGAFQTGDEAEMDADGYLKITGRIKDLIIKGGENIHPLEVENCLFGHPSIAEVSVVGLPDERYGEVVAAFIIPHRGANITATEAKTWVREKLSHHLGKAHHTRSPCTASSDQRVTLLTVIISAKVRVLGRQLSEDGKRKDTEVQAEGSGDPACEGWKGAGAMTPAEPSNTCI